MLGAARRALIVEDFGRQKVDLDAADAVARSKDQSAFDDVPQLPDVAGPVVRLERGHGFFGDGRRGHPPLGGEAGEEMADELRDVFAALAQRRQLTGTTLSR